MDGLKEIDNNFLQNQEKRHLARFELAYKVSQPPQGVFILNSGLIALIAFSPEGKEHLLRLILPGHLFGHRSYFLAEPYYAEARALEPSQILFIKGKDWDQYLDTHPELGRKLLRYLSRQLSHSERMHFEFLDQEVLARIAEGLIYLQKLRPKYHWTRREIAQFCNTTPATVIKTLAKMEAMGWIQQQKGRGIVILKSMQDQLYKETQEKKSTQERKNQ